MDFDEEQMQKWTDAATGDISKNSGLSKYWGNPVPAIIDDDELRCPNCNIANSGAGLHPQLADMVIWPDFDNYDSPAGTRGEFVLIPLVCEGCDADQALVMGNHKGVMKMRIVTRIGRFSRGSGRNAWNES